MLIHPRRGLLTIWCHACKTYKMFFITTKLKHLLSTPLENALRSFAGELWFSTCNGHYSVTSISMTSVLAWGKAICNAVIICVVKMLFTLDYPLAILHCKFAEYCRFQLEWLPGCVNSRGKILKTSHSHLHGAEKIQICFLVLHLNTCTVITEICIFIALLRQHRRNFQCKIV